MWLTIVFLHILAFSGALGDERSDAIRDVLSRARQKVAEEDRMYKTRYDDGYDKVAKNFTTIEPSMFDTPPPEAAEIEKQSRLINWISYFIRRDRLSITLQDVLNSPASNGVVHCPFNAQITCQPSKYRSINGTCNNLEHPLRGSVFIPFARDLPPVYEQGVNDIDDHPRKTGTNGLLPNARKVSKVIHQNANLAALGGFQSFFFAAWGQFLAHTFTEKAVSSGFNSSIVNCCTGQRRAPTPQVECSNIDVPQYDFLRARGVYCLPLLRTLEATDINCRTGRREQVNAATSFIDASSVYGSTEEKAQFLRTHDGGELVMSEPNELPIQSNGNKLAEKMGFAFLQAGDPRASENSFLVGMHTLWLREHNRIARFLKLFSPNWSDEKLYQETRKIVSAMIQHITYKEWLPILLGSSLMTKYNLDSKGGDNSYGYDSTIDATTTNIMATAAFRFGHSLISSTYNLHSNNYNVSSSGPLRLKKLFLRPNMYLLNEQNLMRGLLVGSSQPMDPFITHDLANNLMETRPGNGADLVAINIQRGRDHGLPSYNEWRRAFNLSVASSFTCGQGGFTDIHPTIVAALSTVYSDPNDVDVWTAGVSETPVTGAVVGPLFANIIGRQFERYKRGDRFWYETRELPQAFTEAQLATIRNTTLALVICNHFEVDMIQPEAFKLNTVDGNGRLSCSSLPQLRLLEWDE